MKRRNCRSMIIALSPSMSQANLRNRAGLARAERHAEGAECAALRPVCLVFPGDKFVKMPVDTSSRGMLLCS